MDKRKLRERLNSARRVVIKIGSTVIVDKNRLNNERLKSIARDIAWLAKERSVEVAIVSSGAVASGMAVMGLKVKPDNIVQQQALAAIGQPHLIDAYQRCFSSYGITVAQVLITVDDIHNRRRFINAKNSLSALLKWKCLPIINENDTVVIKELRFGDNDNLASYVVNLVEADALIMLTGVDGVYSTEPDGKNAKLIESIGRGFDYSGFSHHTRTGSGGIRSKIEAGLRVAEMGKLAVVVNGKREGIVKSLFVSDVPCTVFEPLEEPVTSKQSWIMSCKPAGVIVVDRGAADSIRNNRSLLASGIVKVYGAFERGDVVNIEDEEGRCIARGMVNYDASEIEKIKGKHSSEIGEILGYKYSSDVVHIDNMVLEDTCD